MAECQEIALQDLGCLFINNLLNANQVIMSEDITNAIIEMTFRHQLNSEIVFDFSTEDGTIVITDAINGTFIRLERKLTYPPGIYYADTTIKYNNGTVLTLYRQKLEIKDSYTKLL